MSEHTSHGAWTIPLVVSGHAKPLVFSEGVALSRLRASMRAGVCVLLAAKSMAGLAESRLSILARAGLNVASAINAVKRLGLDREKHQVKPDTCRSFTATA